jgi:hypothetical protein
MAGIGRKLKAVRRQLEAARKREHKAGTSTMDKKEITIPASLLKRLIDSLAIMSSHAWTGLGCDVDSDLRKLYRTEFIKADHLLKQARQCLHASAPLANRKAIEPDGQPNEPH